MNNNDVMVLDAYKTVYTWIGLNSNKTERKAAEKKAYDYVEGVADGRDPKSV